MEYTTIGSTGMTVSRIGLGTLHFGTNSEGWRIGADQSRKLIERAIDLGITYFDTSNIYRNGQSEQVLGNVLADYDRDRYVLATKVYGEMDNGNPNAQGLSRKAIEQELVNSLDRLGIDTIDLYQIHRWDYDTPVEETLRTLDNLVRRQQIRYLGASSMWVYQFAEALHTSDQLNLERFGTMQNHYNLVYREEEREMIPLCEEKDIGIIPWSPLAQGYLTRPDEEFETSDRSDDVRSIDTYRAGCGVKINERVQEIAEENDVTMAQVAIAWHLHKDYVSAPVIGVSNVEHLEEIVEATEISLSGSDIKYLEDPYEPVPVSGHS